MARIEQKQRKMKINEKLKKNKNKSELTASLNAVGNVCRKRRENNVKFNLIKMHYIITLILRIIN